MAFSFVGFVGPKKNPEEMGRRYKKEMGKLNKLNTEFSLVSRKFLNWKYFGKENRKIDIFLFKRQETKFSFH